MTLPADFNSVKLSQMGLLMFFMGGIKSPAPSTNEGYKIIFAAKENGTLAMSMTVAPLMTNEDYISIAYDFIPQFVDGKELDYWKVNDDALTAGQTLAIDMASAEQINTQLFSRDVVPGGGGSESEDINSSAQTGDMGIYVIVALAIMAISAGVVFAARRRIN